MKQSLLWITIIWSVVFLYACGTTQDEVVDPSDGFVSAGSEDTNDRGNYEDGDESAEAADGDTQDGGNDVAREIAESDIFQVVDSTIFVINRYRGLAIIDASNPNDLKIVSRVSFEGDPREPKEMFVTDGVATVLLSANGWYYAREADEDKTHNSGIVTIDISDLSNPSIIEEFKMQGAIKDSRRVGDVIYVVGSMQRWWDWCDGESQNEGTTEVVSINIGDASNVFEADRESFTGQNWAIYVTTEAIYVAESLLGENWYDYEAGSQITYLDISDPEGLIIKRDTFQVSAIVADRFKMYQDENVFAAVSNTSSWNGDTLFETFDVSDTSDIKPLGSITVMEEESLHATRFEGRRAYVVTFRNTDPLFVIDFTDADNPTVLGDLEIPGWSTHLEIRGTKLLGVGVDDQDGWRTKVALFDVEVPTNPTILDTVTLGEGYSWSEANADWKAFKIYDDENLILVPSSGYDNSYRSYVNLLNIIDFEGDALTLRGQIASPSPVRRGFLVGDHIGSMSETSLQMIDYSDRDNPVVLDELVVASYVDELRLCGDALCNTGGGWYGGSSRLQLFDPNDDSESPYWVSPILEQSMYGGWYNQQVINRGDRTYLLSQSYGYWLEGDTESGASWQDEQGTRVHAFDMSDSKKPEYLGSALLNSENSQNQYYYYSYYGNKAGITDSNVLAQFEIDYDDNYRPMYNMATFDLTSIGDTQSKAFFSDLKPLLGNYYLEPVVRGDSIWVPTCEEEGKDDNGLPYMRCFAKELDASNSDNIVEARKVNIPGHLVGANEDASILYAIDKQFGEKKDNYVSCKLTLEILKRNENVASRVASLDLYSTDYCYYHVRDYDTNPDTSDPSDGKEPDVAEEPDGDTSEPEVDGDTTEPSDGEDLEGAVYAASPDEEVRTYTNLAGVFYEAERIFIVESTYSYSYGDAVSSDGCGGYYDYQAEYTMDVRVVDATTGEILDTMELKDVNQVSQVDGGGLMFKGTTYNTYPYMMTFLYVTPQGDLISLEEATMTSYYYSSSQSAIVDGKLYIPMGWSGIRKFDIR